MYWAAPKMMVGAVITGKIAEMASCKLSEYQIFHKFELWADYFAKVTSNLNAFYRYASQTVSSSFEEKDPKKVMQAVCDLVEANGKDQEGSFQMMFDHRDKEL